MRTKESQFIGSLIGTAIGDSLSARIEGITDVQSLPKMGPRYTDDTVMTLAVAESLIERKGYDYWDMTDRLVRNYEQEPWRRYGTDIPRIFRMMQSGKMGFGMLDRQLYSEGSFGNGAAKRVSPVGLLYHDNPRMMREIAYHTAGITHSNDLALEGAALQACAVALAVLTNPGELKAHEFLGALRIFTKPGPYQEKLKIIMQFLTERAEKTTVLQELGNGNEALHSVPTAIYAFLVNDGFENAVAYAVSLGGDSDTIGAMCGAIAGAYYGRETIPDRWKEKVENREHLIKMGKQLWAVKQHLVP
ncbi:MAG: ADP-ribosylglycohydrolase family protein [Nitrospirota bacterium]